MKWMIRKLLESKQELLSFEEIIDITQKSKEIEPSIIDLQPVKVKGYFSVREQDIVLHCNAIADITLPSTRSLEPVQLELIIPIAERYVTSDRGDKADEYEETTIVLEHDYIDLEQAVLESLILNLPQRVVSEDEELAELPKGKNWAVLTEDEYHQQQQANKPAVDPRLAKLQSLLNENKATE